MVHSVPSKAIMIILCSINSSGSWSGKAKIMLTMTKQADVMAKSWDKLIHILSQKHFLHLESKTLVLIDERTCVAIILHTLSSFCSAKILKHLIHPN